MLLSLLKALLLSVVVLLIGQIRLGDDTLAGKFHAEVKSVCRKSGEKLMQTKVLAGIANTSYVQQWIGNVYPPKDKPAPEVEEVKGAEAPEGAEVDAFSTSDRESILRLLQ